MIWLAHRLAHPGDNKTTNRIELTWYWLGMVAEVQKVFRTCEMCHVTKSGEPPAGERQRFYAGCLWSQVVVDLVIPVPETPGAIDGYL